MTHEFEHDTLQQNRQRAPREDFDESAIVDDGRLCAPQMLA